MPASASVASAASRRRACFGFVGGGLSLGAAELGVLAGSVGCLVGAGELVGDVAGRPGRLAFVGPDPDPELAVGELELFAVDVGAAEGLPGGAVGGVGLDLAGCGRGTEGVVGVVVALQLAPVGDGAGRVEPLLSFLRVGRAPARVPAVSQGGGASASCSASSAVRWSAASARVSR